MKTHQCLLLAGLALSAGVPCAASSPPAAADPSIPRFAAPPTIARRADGTVEWSGAADCGSPAALNALLGARVFFALDYDLDGAADAVDSAGIAPGDCEEGRVPLRKVLAPNHPALLRAEPRAASGAAGAAHVLLTAGMGSMLVMSRYCARPKNGEPEWIQVRNRTAFPVSLASIRLEARVLSGTLAAGEAVMAGSDTAELRLWQPGARLIALSSWSNLRNSGDTIRLSYAGSGTALMLDSVIYPSTGSGGAGAGSYPLEDCASLRAEGSAASASGYALDPPFPRWTPHRGAYVLKILAPASGRYDLRAYDLDGAERCILARDGTGPSSVSFPFPACPCLDGRAGAVILKLQPRGAPGVRTVLRITE